MSNKLPVIPLSEYPARWALVQQMMEQNNLDLLLVYADDHATYGPAYARWLANFYVHFEPVCMIFTQQQEPIMLVGPESPAYAKLHTPIKDVRVLKEFTHPDEDYLFSKIESFADIVGDLLDKDKIKRVGVAGQSMISYDLMTSFKETLPAAWVNVDLAMGDLRAIKSPAELEVIAYAYEVAQAGLLAAIEAVKPGIQERLVAAEAEYVMRKMGAEGLGIDTFVASGKHSSPIIARTTMDEIPNNNIVMLTFAPRYEGYHAAVAVPVLVGNPSDQIKKALEAAIEAQTTCSKLLKAGADCGVEAKAREIMTQAGLGHNFLYSGIHSVGVIEFEAPIFGPSSKEVMAENMILSVDIPVFGNSWGGFRIEDGYQILPAGAKRLTNIEYWVQK